MASITGTHLDVQPTSPPSDELLVLVDYEIVQTGNDLQTAQAYRELVQLFSKGGLAGPGELVIPGGTLRDEPVIFTDAQRGYQRTWSITLPIAVLENGRSPLQADPIEARVTLTPIPPAETTAKSNLMPVNQAPVLTP
jgi:hypothetical protein